MLNLKKLSKLLLLLSTTIFVNALQANEQTLATISNDESKNTYQLIIDSTEDSRTIKVLYRDLFVNGKKYSREILDFRAMTNSGIILEQRDKYIVMSLKSDNFDEEQGGIVKVDTLYNGVNGTRKSYDVSIEKDKTGWALMNQGKVITQILVQTNIVKVLGPVGIKNLVME